MEVYNLEKLPSAAEEIVRYYFHCLNKEAKQLVKAFYITGSAVLNDFYDAKSDLDFIAILKEEPDAKRVKSFTAFFLLDGASIIRSDSKLYASYCMPVPSDKNMATNILNEQ